MTRLLSGILLGVIIAAIGVWYVGVYDTAEGRCQRGDLDACTVLQQRAAAQAQAEADVAAAEGQAAVQRAIDLEEERGREGRCFLQLIDHAATVRVSGAGADDTCQMLQDGMPGWQRLASVDDAGLRAICTVPYGGPTAGDQTLTVLDSGGATYGTELCQEFGF